MNTNEKIAQEAIANAKARAEQAERRAHEARGRAERAKTRAEHARSRLDSAETRAEHAETRTEFAKTRTEHAEIRAEQAEIRTEQVKTRAELAEARAEKAELRAKDYEEVVQELVQTVVKHPVPDAAAVDEAPERRALDQLPPRQREVLHLIAAGHNTKQIAAGLGISPKTVEYHRLKLMRSLNVHDIPGLVRFALRVGLVSPEA